MSLDRRLQIDFELIALNKAHKFLNKTDTIESSRSYIA